MIEIIYGLLILSLIAAACFAIFSTHILNSVIALAIFSINLAVLFIILQAPDVAMTEAVIGSGLVTALYIITINKTEEL